MHWFVVNHFPPLRTDEGSTGDESECESERKKWKWKENCWSCLLYALVCCKSLSPSAHSIRIKMKVPQATKVKVKVKEKSESERNIVEAVCFYALVCQKLRAKCPWCILSWDILSFGAKFAPSRWKWKWKWKKEKKWKWKENCWSCLFLLTGLLQITFPTAHSISIKIKVPQAMKVKGYNGCNVILISEFWRFLMFNCLIILLCHFSENFSGVAF